jgi:hypothetical protein
MIERRPSLRPPLHDGGLSVGNASMLPALRFSVGSLRARLTRPRHFSRGRIEVEDVCLSS